MNNIEKYKLKDIGKWEDRIYDYHCSFGPGKMEDKLEAGRYELIIYGADALSHYVELSLLETGLEEKIIVRILDPFKPEDEEELANYYLTTDADKKLDYTVPVLVDRKNGRIVSNDPFDMVRVFESVWSNRSDLITRESEKLNHEIFQNLYMEGYRAGFAEDQIEYNAGYQTLFMELDTLEERLNNNTFLTGDTLTDADILLFAFLVRFDIQYVAAFRINRNLLRDMYNLWTYAKRLYSYKNFKNTIDFEEIKKYAFLRTVATNPNGKLPLGLYSENWEN